MHHNKMHDTKNFLLQVQGVEFLWQSVFETLEHAKNHPGSGSIIAHCMGLGKTLQVIIFMILLVIYYYNSFIFKSRKLPLLKNLN